MIKLFVYFVKCLQFKDSKRCGEFNGEIVMKKPVQGLDDIRIIEENFLAQLTKDKTKKIDCVMVENFQILRIMEMTPEAAEKFKISYKEEGGE